MTPILFLFLFATYISSAAFALQSLQCEGKTNQITCPERQLISISEANYGRTAAAHQPNQPVVCPHRATSNRKCGASNSMTIVDGACEGKNSCSVRASNGVFGDPCGGTYKYLNISYECVGPSVAESTKQQQSAAELQQELTNLRANAEIGKTSTACEHKTLKLECRAGTIVKINSAVYGRSDRTTCTHPAMSNTNCAATQSLNLVGKQCEGMFSCQVPATNGYFGDPCRGTFKYLMVNYDCVVPNEEEAQREIKAQLLDPFKGQIILQTGCSPLDRLTFPKGTKFSDRVGAKIVTKSMSNDFKWDEAMEMKEVYCGAYAVNITPQADEEFGFYLYDKEKPDDEYSAVSDIGCKGDPKKCPQGDVVGDPLAACTDMVEWSGSASQNRRYKGDQFYSWGTCEDICAVEPEPCPSDLVQVVTPQLGKRDYLRATINSPQVIAGVVAVSCLSLFAIRKYRLSFKPTSNGEDAPLTQKYNSINVC